MKKFEVILKEVWTQQVFVEAENEEEALENALNGTGEYGSFEYSHTLEDSGDIIERPEEE